MNDYRSTFNGVNDHEADWEQVFIYLEETAEGPVPVWIAAAAHDYSGDELRRRWDDPTLAKVGDHVVINAGAGSHASYFERGEYLTQVPIPALRGLGSFLDVVREFWRDTLRQPDPGDLRAKLSSALSVPFVDYARGDGMAIGPDQPEAWSAVLIDDSTDWVDGYRGLFGLDTYDRFAGERAPAGPKYGRSGTVRQSWNDPLGLRRPGQDGSALPAARGDRRAHRRPWRRRPPGWRPTWPASPPSCPDSPSRCRPCRSRAPRPRSSRLGRWSSRRARGSWPGSRRGRRPSGTRWHRSAVSGPTSRPACWVTRSAISSTRTGRSRRRRPATTSSSRSGRPSASGVLLLLVAGLVFFRLVPWWGALIVGFVGYILIESALRRRLTLLLLRLVLVLAVVGAVILVFDFRLELILAAVAGLALLVVADNVREVTGR